MKTVCPLCQSTALLVVATKTGPHHAKRVCPSGHFVEWVARPRDGGSEVPAELAELVTPRDKLASLRGTPNQVAAARALRSNAISFANKADRPDYTRLLACVNDAGWFLANRGLFPPDLKCWPRPDQIETTEGAAR